jgi:hypothetical protein
MTSSPPVRRQLLPSRTFLVAGAGALLAAGAIGLALHQRPAAAARVAIVLAAPATAAPAPAAVPAPEPSPPAPPAPADAAAVREARARAAAAPTITRLVPSRGRFLVTRAIELQAPLAACFAPRAGAAVPVRPASRRSLVAAGSRGVLRLELEPQLGEIWILDATVEARGTGTDAELACARRALKGLALEVPASTPGERVAMLYPLP